MKKISGIVLFVILILSTVVFAEDYAVFGGVKGDLTLKAGVYYYQEICFITGKPVVLKGTVTIPSVSEQDEYNLAIKYEASNTAEQITMSRNVTYKVKKSRDNGMNQVIIDTVIEPGKLKESYTVKGDAYQLTSFQFANSQIVDEHPGITFESGNIFYKKVFHIGGDEKTASAKLIIEGTSVTDLSYSNFWSNLTTRIIDLKISHQPLAEGASDGWDGTATLKYSADKSTNFNYIKNDVQNISFRGGLLKVENSHNVLNYTYDFKNPEATKEKPTSARLKGSDQLNAYSFEKSSRLPIPKYRDLGDHWSTNESFRMGSLEAFDTGIAFFPDIAIHRDEFARAIVNSIDHLAPESAKTRKSEAILMLRRNAKQGPFVDVPRESPYYIYTKRVFDKGLMIGEGNGYFKPSQPLTRAEAITVMIRALGIQDIAPALDYDTGYSDDNQIPIWAKDAIYMAKQVGIVKGYPDNTIRPLNIMTRAETATMLSQFIDHLRQDITIDYREKLLNQY